MSLQPVIRPRAIQDVIEAADYLALEASGTVSSRFLANVDQTIRFLCESPRVGDPED